MILKYDTSITETTRNLHQLAAANNGIGQRLYPTHLDFVKERFVEDPLTKGRKPSPLHRNILSPRGFISAMEFEFKQKG